MNIALVNFTATLNHLGCQLVSLSLLEFCVRSGHRLVTANPVHQHWVGQADNIAQADLCIVNGEGTIHHNAKHAGYLLQLAQFCKQRSVPVVLINATVQAMSGQWLQRLQLFDAVFVRELASRQLLLARGVRAYWAADLSFGQQALVQQCYQAAVDTQDAMDESTAVSLTWGDSVDADISTKLHKLQSALVVAPGQLMPCQREQRLVMSPESFAAIQRCIKPYIRHVSLLPWVSAQRVPERLPGTLQVFQQQVVTQLQELFAPVPRRELLITGRFHAICMALMAGIPILAVASNSYKIQSMLMSARLANRYVEEPQAITWAMIQPYAQWSETERQGRLDYLRIATESIEHMFHYLNTRFAVR